MCLSRKGELDEIMACEICPRQLTSPVFSILGGLYQSQKS